jgi:hypothetical protein
MKEKQSRSHTRSLNINNKQIEMGEKKRNKWWWGKEAARLKGKGMKANYICKQPAKEVVGWQLRSVGELVVSEHHVRTMERDTR